MQLKLNAIKNTYGYIFVMTLNIIFYTYIYNEVLRLFVPCNVIKTNRNAFICVIHFRITDLILMHKYRDTTNSYMH